MSVRKMLDVFCDFCIAWTDGGGAKTPQKARAHVRRTNPRWKTRRMGGQLVDLCPDCEAKRKNGEL